MRLWRHGRVDNVLERELLVATTGPGLGLGRQVLSSELEIGVRWSETNDGIPFLPVFSSETRLLEWFPEGSHWLGLQGRDMLELFLGGEWEAMVVDPTLPNHREVFRDEARRLLEKDD